MNQDLCLRVAHLAHDGDERLVACVCESNIEHRLELLMHRSPRVRSETHLQWLVYGLAPVATPAVGNSCVVGSVDGQCNDYNENGGDL
jgi:hypothetical protein